MMTLYWSITERLADLVEETYVLSRLIYFATVQFMLEHMIVLYLVHISVVRYFEQEMHVPATVLCLNT